VVRDVVPEELINDALRLIHMDIVERGASAETLGEWLWSAHWFPHLNYSPEILALARALPEEWQTGTLCDPQILLQFPHVGEPPQVTFHVDQEPEWGDGRRYVRIVGIPLSPWRRDNGGLIVAADDRPIPLELEPGDAVMMTPDLPHSGGVNTSGSIRYGVYVRWLEEGEPAPFQRDTSGTSES
jgi:ectoine hydroxylase-related dioxygenase (phytanoyl-CoA dioxygenase family)